MEEWKARLRAFASHFGSGLIDTLFMMLWVVLQWAFGRVVVRFPLSGLHANVLESLEAVFAVGTMVPILGYVTVDVCRIFWATKKSIEGLATK